MVHVTESKALWYRSNAFVWNAIIPIQTFNMDTQAFTLKCLYLTENMTSVEFRVFAELL
jgi:hypothetical protein